ncbi:Regulatory protein RecX [Candidatus Gullanella endobia]|uniref:Regulatory protein RecX n=1 Tax=Candidatus Gullanella endobia TaxID=1070130 RepID=A0A143WQQ0_9ENTR|nr:regulatory protein RecX [Candidatus Gullanella endobia]CUX96062.1 Regulatory protein RecX [Candidatus Gullanella endobia]
MVVSLFVLTLQFLFRRNYTEAELRRKLIVSLIRYYRFRKWPNIQPVQFLYQQAKINQVIDYCCKHHWLDNSCFAKHYANWRSEKGYSEQRIRIELFRKGISRDNIDAAFAKLAVDRTAAVAKRSLVNPCRIYRRLKTNYNVIFSIAVFLR